jgi:hypothetical protein
MKFRLSLFGDALLGSAVPLGGDPITAFQIVPLLGLRTATVLYNCKPIVGDVVKARFIATNCGERPLEVVRSIPAGRERDLEYSERNSTPLLPGESLEHCVFRSWDAAGAHQLTLMYEVRCPGQPFARLTYPPVAIRVSTPKADKLAQWIWGARATHQRAR